MGLIWLAGGLLACSQTSLPDGGGSKKIRLTIGEIKEISVPNRGDSSQELIGTSDNQEIVEVSRPGLAPALDTLNRDRKGPTIFQLKAVTEGTVKVVFATKPLNQTGNGQPVRTYIVRVLAK